MQFHFFWNLTMPNFQQTRHAFSFFSNPTECKFPSNPTCNFTFWKPDIANPHNTWYAFSLFLESGRAQFPSNPTSGLRLSGSPAVLYPGSNCWLQKRHTIWIWVQFLWTFSHFAARQRFFVPRDCTILGCFVPSPGPFRVQIGFFVFFFQTRTLCAEPGCWGKNRIINKQEPNLILADFEWRAAAAGLKPLRLPRACIASFRNTQLLSNFSLVDTNVCPGFPS